MAKDLRRVAVFAGGCPHPTSRPEWHGWFHGWAGKSEYPLAIVEREDGRIETVAHDRVRFVEPPSA